MQGSLCDVTLPVLLQTLCTRTRSARLSLSQSGEEGTICIDHGDISHAAIGTLRGEAAFYRLLTWNRASFQTVEVREANQRTIAKPWRQLILEGLVHLDEASRTDSKSQARADWALEEELLDFLASCDLSLEPLRARELCREPLEVLELLQNLLDGLAAAPRIGEKFGTTVEPLRTARNSEVADLPVLRVQWQDGRPSLAEAVRLYRQWPGTATHRKLAFQALCGGLVTIFERYLDLPAGRFHSTELAACWQETYRIYLGELSICLDDVDF